MRCHLAAAWFTLADWFNLRPDVIYVTGEFLLPLNLRKPFSAAQ